MRMEPKASRSAAKTDADGVRPHLVIDGAMLAAESFGASRVLLYVGEAHRPRSAAMARSPRRCARRPSRARHSAAGPPSYVAGEETAAVNS